MYNMLPLSFSAIPFLFKCCFSTSLFHSKYKLFFFRKVPSFPYFLSLCLSNSLSAVLCPSVFWLFISFSVLLAIYLALTLHMSLYSYPGLHLQPKRIPSLHREEKLEKTLSSGSDPSLIVWLCYSLLLLILTLSTEKREWPRILLSNALYQSPFN